MNAATLNPCNPVMRSSSTEQVRPVRSGIASRARMLVHDLRHFAQAIVGSLDTLQMALEERDLDLATKSLARLKQSMNQLVDMLGHLLANPRKNRDGSAECDVNQVVEHVVDLLQPLLRQKRIGVCKRVDAPIAALINTGDLSRLLLNLLVNAIEVTTEQDARITIEAGTTPHEWVWITIRDNGSGVREKDSAHIFEEGYTTKTRQTNKGLGLAIVREILETHRGAVRVRSYPGKGTEVTVWLPSSKNTHSRKYDGMELLDSKEDTP